MDLRPPVNHRSVVCLTGAIKRFSLASIRGKPCGKPPESMGLTHPGEDGSVTTETSMFVNATRLTANGERFEHLTTNGRKTSQRFATLAEAEAALTVMTTPIQMLSGYTSRAYMQKGVIGYRQYKKTPYEALFVEASTSGVNREISDHRGIRPFETIVAPLVFTDFAMDPLFRVSPEPQRLYFTGSWGNHPVGVANRAVIQNTVNRAQAEARQRAADQKIDLSETLVDLDKSALMVADGTLRVLRALRSVKRGNFDAAMRYLGIDRRKPPKFKDAANAWLALQYGWLPLLNDVFSGFEALKVILDPTANPHQLYSTRRLGQQLVMPIWEVQGDHTVLKNEAQCSVEVKFSFSVSDPFLSLLGQLGLTNPASMAWAALPYSFVVDWFLPVGTMLGALSAPIGLKYQSGYTTTRSWGEVEIRRTRLPQYGNVVHNSGVSRVKHKAAKISRTVHKDWPTVLPYVRLPFSNPTRLINAAALIETSKRRG